MQKWGLMLAGLLLLLVGIPVTDPTVISKCGGCHPVDSQGMMQRLSFERASPEGWQQVLKRMLRTNQISITPPEARDIVRYLSDTHGLSPQESEPVMYESERRIHDEDGAGDLLLTVCAKCHSLATALSWRRSSQDWKEFADSHAAQYKIEVTPEVIAGLAKAAPLDNPEWSAWSSRSHSADLTGRWLLTAHVLGKGKFVGFMEVTDGAVSGEFLTRVTLRSIQDGSTLQRVGRIAVYAGHEWRGRSKGTLGSDDLSPEAREAMWISPDGKTAHGRWFWGQYQEFGFDVSMQRSSGSTLLAVDIPFLKIGSRHNKIRLLGDHFPDRVTLSDITAGQGIAFSRILSASSVEVVAELDVTDNALPGKRDVTLASSRLPGALAIYDRIDYVKVIPDSAMAAFANDTYSRGFQQFEAVAFQRGPDNRLHSADDLELGPVPADWSMEVFYETDTSKNALVGSVNQTGFFTPAAKDPGMNYDVWIIATTKYGTGKSYVVLTVPTYTFEGRSYVRDLDRWIEEQK